MQTTVMNIDRISSGSEIPSIPMWYREWITGIHCLFTTNCRPALS